jgi:alkanesulfonate monooxygenase SsuD/methylene tetrahydromethanopterin reductase-like flavin-dependent oxidoreductase (luciferase family)
MHMGSFKPTLAPPGRLVRLGVVLDTRNSPTRLQEIARMADRAGVDALWIDDHPTVAGEPRLEAWTSLVLAGREASRVRMGAMLTVGFRPPAMLAAMAATLDLALGGRVEVGFRAGSSESAHRAFGVAFGDDTDRSQRMDRYAGIVRSLLTGQPVSAAGTLDLRDARLGVLSPQPGGPPISIEARGLLELEVAVRRADTLVLPAGRTDVATVISEARVACDRAARDPQSLGIAIEARVSIGRTSAEARARATMDPWFRDPDQPETVTLVGALEQCQDQVIALAHLGVSDLRCRLPNTPDVPDAIAQLTAAVVGSTAVLLPGSRRSRAPDPPAGWGGRPRRP